MNLLKKIESISLDPNLNDLLSEKTIKEKQELLRKINSISLVLRDHLGFDSKVTFGLELEFEQATLEKIYRKLFDLHLEKDWQTVFESSIPNGGEIDSPILKDQTEDWKQLKQVCRILKRNAKLGNLSGGHIHIGTQVLGAKKESWTNFFQLWATYENILYRFCYGNYLTARKYILNYARPMSKQLWDLYPMFHKKDIDLILTECCMKFGQAINFFHVRMDCLNQEEENNTIEFRLPNASFDPVVLQNNVNLLVQMLKYASSSKFDSDLVLKRHQIMENYYNDIVYYNQIFGAQALEFSDLVFSNNLDKIYFLRQYIKSFDIGSEPLQKSKKFTK